MQLGSMNHTCEPRSNMSNVTADLLGGHQIWEVALIVLVTGPLSFITILGNLLVLISFRVNSQLRTVSNYYLLSLAVADLILGMVSMNLYTAYIIMGHWMLGHLACDLWLALDYVASNASVMNLLVISFDRYFSVTRPLTYRARRTPKRAAQLIALAWAVSFVLWAPAILFWPHGTGQPSTEEVRDCSIPFLAEPSLTFGTAIAAFYLPASIMIVLYWRIYWEIENRAKGLAKFTGSVSSSDGNSIRAEIPSVYQNSEHSSFSSLTERVPRKGQRPPRKESVGCFPGRPKSLETENANMVPPAEEFDYKETYSNSSWNIDEEDDGTTSSLTEEEQEQDLQGTAVSAKNPAAIRLKHLHGSSEEPQGNPASAADPTVRQDSTPCSPRTRGPPDTSLRKPAKAKWRLNTIIREKKAARMLSTILLAFILTWTPYNIMVLASISYCVPEKLWQLGYWLCYVNSTVNPMCYALTNGSFRATFKTLLTFRRGVDRRWEAGRQSQHASVRQDKSCSAV
ncbi:muscarinic acetylcholine receptor M1 [Brachyhypopomus gauderio]|uniref:muscarinic acetylcholine receptor M1 n=1 Tax=Brachyhypopomus gauderio TaxID=698409 RepID=UPI004042B460